MSETLTQKIVREVELKISSGEYAIGSMLPESDVLAKEFSCSPATVERGLRILRRSGTLKGIRHKGTVVIRRPPKALVALILSGDAHINQALQEEVCTALSEANFDLELVPVTGGPSVVHRWCSRLLYKASNRPDYLVELHPTLATQDHPEYQEVLDSLPNRVVYNLDGSNAEKAYSTLSINPTKEARLVADYLMGKGHKRIGIWAEHNPENLQTARGRYPKVAREMISYIQNAGCSALPVFGYQTEEKIKALVKKDKITALYDLNDSVAVRTMMLTYRAGFNIPNDLAIVGRHNTPHSLTADPNLTSVSLNPSMTAKTIVKALNHLIAGNKPKNYNITPKIIERGSA